MADYLVEVRTKNPWQYPVKDKDLTTSPIAVKGDRYIIAGTGGQWSGFANNDIVYCTTAGEAGTAVWSNYIPSEGWLVWVEDENRVYRFLAAWAEAFLENIVEDTTPQLGGELDSGAHSIGFTQQSTTGDGTTTIDWKLGNKFYFTFGAQNDTFTFTAPTKPGNFILILKQDGTGSREATWPGTVMWPGGVAPTLSTDGGAIDIISLYWDGTNWFGNISLDFSIPA